MSCDDALSHRDVYCEYVSYFFVFKQKTAYEMRISDWSSDVCSSDLPSTRRGCRRPGARRVRRRGPQARRATSSARLIATTATKIGRASCRERVCQYV